MTAGPEGLVVQGDNTGKGSCREERRSLSAYTQRSAGWGNEGVEEGGCGKKVTGGGGKMGMECDSDGEARSSGDFWRWLGGRQQARELELFFFFPPASYWPAPGCELAEVGPLNVSGARPPPDAASPKLGPGRPKKKGGAFHGGLLLVFLGDQGDLLLL